MKEEVREGCTGNNFRVYPYAENGEILSSIYVEADGDYWSRPERTLAVRLHVDAWNFSREDAAPLMAAIERCWQWIDEQRAAVTR